MNNYGAGGVGNAGRKKRPTISEMPTPNQTPPSTRVMNKVSNPNNTPVPVTPDMGTRNYVNRPKKKNKSSFGGSSSGGNNFGASSKTEKKLKKAFLDNNKKGAPVDHSKKKTSLDGGKKKKKNG